MAHPDIVRLSPKCHCRTWSPITLPKPSLPLRTTACHCRSCRLVSGSIVSYLVRLPDGTAPAHSEEEKATLGAYKSSDAVTRLFCKRCGAKTFLTEVEDGEEVHYVHLGIFPPTTSEGIKTYSLQAHIFVQPEDAGGLLRYTSYDGVPQFAQDSSGSTALNPSTWSDSAHKAAGSAQAKLPLKCHCGAFYGELIRPSACKDWSGVIFNTVKDDTWRWVLCMCTSCRTTSGQPLSPLIFIPPEAFIHPSGAIPSTTPGLTRYESTPGQVARSFCSTCGANVFYERAERESVGGFLDVFLGVVDAPLGEVLEGWLMRRPVGNGEDGNEKDAVHLDVKEVEERGWRESVFQ